MPHWNKSFKHTKIRIKIIPNRWHHRSLAYTIHIARGNVKCMDTRTWYSVLGPPTDYRHLRLFAAANWSKISSNKFCPTNRSLNSTAPVQSIVCQSLCAILLNERSPEQLETIRHMYMRSAIKMLGNVSCSCLLYNSFAREAGESQPLDLAKSTSCTISSENIIRLQIIGICNC